LEYKKANFFEKNISFNSLKILNSIFKNNKYLNSNILKYKNNNNEIFILDTKKSINNYKSFIS
jgi:hypothetical protein